MKYCVTLRPYITKKVIDMNYEELNFQGLTNERQWDVSTAFPILMRKVYVWMTLALVITGLTAYGVATTPSVLQAIYGNKLLFWGMVIGEFALVIGVTAGINRLSLSTATLLFILYSVINGRWCSLSRQVHSVRWLLSAISPRRTFPQWVRSCSWHLSV